MIWVQVSAVMHRDPSGRRPRSAGIVQAITVRKRAEEAHRLSEERLRSLGDNLPSRAIYRCQHDKDVVPLPVISRGIERVIGVSPEEIVRDASAVLDTILPEDRAYLDREEVRSREALVPFEVALRLRHRGTREVRRAPRTCRERPTRRRPRGSATPLNPWPMGSLESEGRCVRNRSLAQRPLALRGGAVSPSMRHSDVTGGRPSRQGRERARVRRLCRSGSSHGRALVLLDDQDRLTGPVIGYRIPVERPGVSPVIGRLMETRDP